MDLVVLVQTFGPIVGLMIFMIWKQMQLAAAKPQIDAIAERIETVEDLLRGFEPRLDLIASRLHWLQTINRKITTLMEAHSAEQTAKQDDKGSDLPT